MQVIVCMYIRICLLYWIFRIKSQLFKPVTIFACKNIRAVKIIQNEISTCSLCGPLEQPDNCDFLFFYFKRIWLFFFFSCGKPQTVYGKIVEYFKC